MKNMFKVLFVEKAQKTVESVQAAFERATGQSDWGYDSIEDIEKAERDGFLEFDGDTMTVYADMN